MRMILIAAAALAVASPVAATPAITVIDVPGALATEPAAINDSGTVVGSYKARGGDPCGHYCAFLRAPDGTFTTFGIPGAKSTRISAINASGTVAGTFTPRDPRHSVERSFVRAPDGTISVVRVGGHRTMIEAINDSGFAVGSEDGRGEYLAFVRAPDGTVQTFQFPGCGATYGYAIDRNGTVVGDCRDPVFGPDHAYLRAPDGTATIFDPPGTDAGSAAADIDGHGDIVGFYFASNAMHGYIRDADGTFTSWDIPGVLGVGPRKIRTVGGERVVVGTYFDGALVTHGFLRHADGTVDVLDIAQGRHAAVSSLGNWMNASGVIVGSFTTTKSPKEHGFMRTP